MRNSPFSKIDKEGPAVTVEWWQDPSQDAEEAERVCRACHGRGVTRFDEDCSECGGLGVCFD